MPFPKYYPKISQSEKNHLTFSFEYYESVLIIAPELDLDAFKLFVLENEDLLSVLVEKSTRTTQPVNCLTVAGYTLKDTHVLEYEASIFDNFELKDYWFFKDVSYCILASYLKSKLKITDYQIFLVRISVKPSLIFQSIADLVYTGYHDKKSVFKTDFSNLLLVLFEDSYHVFQKNESIIQALSSRAIFHCWVEHYNDDLLLRMSGFCSFPSVISLVAHGSFDYLIMIV
jgi:hypothetical protein